MHGNVEIRIAVIKIHYKIINYFFFQVLFSNSAYMEEYKKRQTQNVIFNE